MSPGRVGYETAVAAMEARAEAIAEGRAGELVWLLEHPPLYTAADDQLMEFGLTNGPRQHFRKAQLDAVEQQKAADGRIVLR